LITLFTEFMEKTTNKFTIPTIAVTVQPKIQLKELLAWAEKKRIENN